MQFLKKLLITVIKGYQKVFSPLFPKSCRYYPTCSQYTIEALKDHNILYALFISSKRILKCNPFFEGGYDPVPKNKDK